jgi:hypothetical protein
MTLYNAGTSAIAAAMGAKIDIAGPPRGMYLIISDGLQPDLLAERAGGTTVMRLNGCKLLAVLPFDAYLALKQDPGIAHIGPVTVDIQRLTKIAQLLAGSGTVVPGNA